MNAGNAKEPLRGTTANGTCNNKLDQMVRLERRHSRVYLQSLNEAWQVSFVLVCDISNKSCYTSTRYSCSYCYKINLLIKVTILMHPV
jgi:hypothetical protein